MAEKPKKKYTYKKTHRDCPRCGPGTKLGEHKDRRSCGKCGYFEKK